MILNTEHLPRLTCSRAPRSSSRPHELRDRPQAVEDSHGGDAYHLRFIFLGRRVNNGLANAAFRSGEQETTVNKSMVDGVKIPKDNKSS